MCNKTTLEEQNRMRKIGKFGQDVKIKQITDEKK